MFGKRLIVSLTALFMSLMPVAAKEIEPTIYFFGASGCDFCSNGQAFLKRYKVSDARVEYRDFDIIASSEDAEAFVRVVGAIGLSDPRVPMTIVGHHVFVGYEGDDSTGEEIKLAVEQCRKSGCVDVVKAVLSFGADVASASPGWVVNQRSAKFAVVR